MTNLHGSIGKSLSRLPAFPATVRKVTSLANNPDSSLSDLVEVIRLDQAITTNILKTCNSAYFGLRHRVDNVQDAVMHLGRRNVVQAVLAAGCSVYFKDTPGYEADARGLWEHAVGSALLSQILSKKIFKQEDAQLYTAALLHDIGKVILGEFVGEKYDEIRETMFERACSFFDAEEEVLGMNHAAIGGAIASAWNFSHDIRQAIAYHHRPDRHPSTERPVSWLVHLADQGCRMAGIGSGTERLVSGGIDEAIHLFGLTPGDFEDAVALLVTELERARELVDIVQTKPV